MAENILDFVILTLDGGESWSVADALQGTHIFGGTGSGKTSGSGQTIALQMLKSQMGGLVLTVKPDEVADWKSYWKYAGRPAEDLIVFGPKITQETPYSFNILEYEREQILASVQLRFPKESAEQQQLIASSFLTENIVNLFTTIMEVAKRGQGGGGGNDSYWLNSVRQLLRNAIELLNFSETPLTFQNLHEIITSAPASLEEANSLRNDLALGHCSGRFSRAFESLLAIEDRHPRIEDAILVSSYWLKEFPALAPETRSIVLSFYTTASDPFLRGTLRELFSPAYETKPLRPEMTREGKVILLNLPVKEYFELGQYAQVLFKFIFQRSCERTAQKSSRPVFLWSDESQFFLSSQDVLFQTTARSSKVATVYLTQNISNYYALMPGEQGKAQTDSLLGNFVTKIFHSNTDSVTNVWSAELISKNFQYRKSMSSSDSQGTGSERTGRGSTFWNAMLGARANNSYSLNIAQNEVVDYQVPPIRFTQLRTGGHRNNEIVDAIFIQGGRVTRNKVNHQELEFKQFYIQ